MSRIFIALLLATAWLDGHAQSSLPPCPAEPLANWTDCFGTYTFDDGAQYVGGYKDNAQFGSGALISPKGHLLVAGVWKNDRTVTVSGSRWFLVSRSGIGVTFVAMDSIREEESMRRVWVMATLNEPMTQFKTLSIRNLLKFDCPNERFQTVSANSFAGPFGSGDTSPSWTDEKWQYVAPGSAFAPLLRFVCDYQL